MKLIKVSKKMKIYRDIRKLYKHSFPLSERAPFWLLMVRAKASIADFWALYDEDKWIGIAYVIKYKRLAYIFYFAIKEEERSKGYGKKVIDILKRKYSGSKIFLALETLDKEADNYKQRVRRHAFYEKCGLSDLPYKLKEATVTYDIMGIGGAVEPEEYREMISIYIGRFFSRIFNMRIVK